MKNLTLTLLLYFLAFGSNCIYSQGNITRNADHYIPVHSFLKAADSGSTKSLLDNKIAYRHDTWQNGAWAFTDSGRYAYNSLGLVTNNSSLSYFQSSDWVNQTNDMYTYDQQGNQLTHQTQKWTAGENSWTNETNYAVTLNAAGYIITQTYQTWAGDGGWQNTYQFNNSYDADHNLLEQVEQEWNITTGTWKNTRRSIQTVRSNLLLTLSVQSWNDASNDWVNYYQMLYLYNGRGSQVRQIEQLWQNNGWVNFYKDSTAYNERNNATRLISQQWDTATLTWINRFETARTYDMNNNLIVFAQFNWDGLNTTWTPVFYDTYTYSVANKLLNKTETNWNNTSATYVNGYKMDYSYDRNNNLIEFNDFYWGSLGNWIPNSSISYRIDGNNKTVYELDQVFDTYSNSMANTDQYYYYYTINDPTDIQTVRNDLSAELYPNPTNGNNITINLTAAQNADITLNTYDEQGRLVNSEM